MRARRKREREAEKCKAGKFVPMSTSGVDRFEKPRVQWNCQCAINGEWTVRAGFGKGTYKACVGRWYWSIKPQCCTQRTYKWNYPFFYILWCHGNKSTSENNRKHPHEDCKQKVIYELFHTNLLTNFSAHKNVVKNANSRNSERFYVCVCVSDTCCHGMCAGLPHRCIKLLNTDLVYKINKKSCADGCDKIRLLDWLLQQKFGQQCGECRTHESLNYTRDSSGSNGNGTQMKLTIDLHQGFCSNLLAENGRLRQQKPTVFRIAFSNMNMNRSFCEESKRHSAFRADYFGMFVWQRHGIINCMQTSIPPL